MTANSQLLTTEPKKKTKNPKQTKQTTRTGTESPKKWRSHEGLSLGEWVGQRGGKRTENNQHKWQVENRQGEVKNSIENVEVKELICTTHGHELKVGSACGSGCAGWRRINGGNGITVIV